MCTLIALHRCVPGRPLVIAANRDEFLARPAEAPALRIRDRGPILAPLDLEAGGTWLGLNRGGVFAGLTNLRPELPGVQAAADQPSSARPTDVSGSARSSMGAAEVLDAEMESERSQTVDLRSRGAVVMMALDAGSAVEAVNRISKLDVDAYNPFQLLIADAERAWLTVYRGQASITRLEPGVHVIGNVEEKPTGSDDVDSMEPRAQKLARIRSRVEKLVTERSADLLADLGEVCREHVESNSFESTCVHLDLPGETPNASAYYGTRSSLLFERAEQPGASRFWVAEGPPCTQPYEDLSPLLERLEQFSPNAD